MMRMKYALALLLIGAFVLQACGAAPAQAADPVQAAVEEDAAADVPAADAVAKSETDEGATRARDNASDGTAPNSGSTTFLTVATGPLVTVSEATNCRSGPSKDYERVAIVEAGQSAEVVATYPFGPYVVVNNPNGYNTCWLWLEFADQTDFSSFDLPEAVKPPEPEPTMEPFDWTGYWTAWIEGEAWTLYVSTNGSHMSGEFIDNYGNHVILVGQVASSGRAISGTWNWGGRSSSFRMQAYGYSSGQFSGNWGPSFGEFCGSRETLPQPSPCLGP